MVFSSEKIEPQTDSSILTAYISLYCSSIQGVEGNANDKIELRWPPTTQPSIKVTSPNGGEKWQLGSTHSILWAPYNYNLDVNPSGDVVAYLEKLVNGNFVSLGKVVKCGRASIHWDGDLDNCNSGTYPAPGDYYIRVVNNQTGQWDRSDRPFTLIAKDYLKVDLKVNNSDNTITIPADGATYNVSWTSNAETCMLYNGTLPWQNSNYRINNLPPSGTRSIKIEPHTDSSILTAYISLYCSSIQGVEGNANDKIEVRWTPKELGLKSARMQVASASSALGLGVGDTKMQLDAISSALKKLMKDIKELLGG
ncbi:hypothetical protein KJ557_03930 [Patescibacteria group bacterium]|nr:hypothetical protein [Patescibacteria group bacterium]